MLPSYAWKNRESNPRYCGGGSFPKSDGTACPACHKVVSGGSHGDAVPHIPLRRGTGQDAVSAMTRHLSLAPGGNKQCHTAAKRAARTKACRICKDVAPFRTRNYGLFEYTCQVCENQQREDPMYTAFMWSHLEAKIRTNPQTNPNSRSFPGSGRWIIVIGPIRAPSLTLTRPLPDLYPNPNPNRRP